MTPTTGNRTPLLVFGLVCALLTACDRKVEIGPPDTLVKGLLDPCLESGACILEYNEARVEGETCCLAMGGENECDLEAAAGTGGVGDDCLIYATDNTQLGTVCCLYPSRRHPQSDTGQDLSAFCEILLSIQATGDPQFYCDPCAQASDCEDANRLIQRPYRKGWKL